MTEATTKQPIVKNAVTCGICRSPADRYDFGFQCQANPNHMGDLNVGIFSDLTPPTEARAGEATARPFTAHEICVVLNDFEDAQDAEYVLPRKRQLAEYVFNSYSASQSRIEALKAALRHFGDWYITLGRMNPEALRQLKEIVPENLLKEMAAAENEYRRGAALAKE